MLLVDDHALLPTGVANIINQEPDLRVVAEAGNGVEAIEAGAGDILVMKAGEIHGFRCIGDIPLVQLDVHLSPRFIQENLQP